MSFYSELLRRNVIRVGIAYIVVGWVVAQVADFAFETFGAPDWVLKALVVILLLGLPIALIFAWAFEMTPEGIKREKQVDRSQSITSQTGRKLDRMIIVVLLIAVAWFAWDKFGAEEPVATTVAVEEQAQQEGAEEVAEIAADKSVAVLPFVAMSSGPDDEFFADGLTEEILNSLAQLPELLVTARTSAFSFKGEDVPVQEIATTLGVQHIVEGSVRRSGERLRVTAQLIRASDGFHLWSENYDSSSQDVIAVQENIAERIASALDVVLDEGKRDAMREAGLRDVEAFTLYQKGLDAFDRAHGPSDIVTGLTEANAYFDQVIERAPEYAQVYVEHSDLYVHLLNIGIVEEDSSFSDEELENALAAAITDYDAAVRYARSPEMRAMAELDHAFLSGNWRGLSGRIELALRNPGCTEGNWIPVLVNVSGEAGRYIELAEAVLACDPLRSLSWFNLSRSTLWAGNPETALRIAREGMQIAPGEWLGEALVRALIANGLYAEAHETVNTNIQETDMALILHVLIAAHESDSVSLANWREKLYELPLSLRGFFEVPVEAWSGQRDAANRVAARIDERPHSYMVLWQLANWCMCGAPWDLDATPNFAAKIESSGLDWPPARPLEVPLKTW